MDYWSKSGPDSPSFSIGNASKAFHAGHVREFVGDALVAVDAGLFTAGEKLLVGFAGPFALPGKVHVVEVVAVTTFQ